MDIYRLIWGEKLENEMKCGITVVSSDPEDGECPDDDKFIEKWDWLHENHNDLSIQLPHIPFVVFMYREGKGWLTIDYNEKGWELYGNSIMEII